MTRIELQMIPQPEKNGVFDYHLSAGNKHVLLSVNRLSHFAETEITTNGQKEPEKGTTTELYTKVKEILKTEAKNFGPLTYRISTGFTSMKAWTQLIGDGIFHWERAYQSVDDSEKLIVETTITP